MRKAAVITLLIFLGGCSGRSTGDWVEQLNSKDGAQRLHAIRALSDRPADAAVVVPALSEALKDNDPFIRRDAAQALAKLGPSARAAVPALQPLLRDRNQHVRKAVSEALKKIDAAS
jgi:HEAT repeat protein